MDVRLSVECVDPTVRAGFMGLITGLLQQLQLPVTAKPLPHQKVDVDTAAKHTEDVLEVLIKGTDKLSITVLEQIEIPDILVNDIRRTISDLTNAIEAHGSVSLGSANEISGGVSLQDIGLDADAMRLIMDQTHRAAKLTYGHRLTEAQAAEVAREATENLRVYIEERIPNSPVAVATNAMRQDDGTYAFAMAISINTERLPDVIRLVQQHRAARREEKRN